MKCRNQGRVLGRVKEIDVDDLGIRWLQADTRVDRILNFYLPLHTGFK